MDLPDRMRVVAIREPGKANVLEVREEAVPVPGAGEVLIRIAAAGVNRPDVLQRQGRYPLPPGASPLPGLEVAGVVVALGDNAKRHAIGDRLMALTAGGGYAEYCTVHESHCLPVPRCMSFVEAAAVPETFFTVQYNVFMRARLAAGETLLVHGGSSGIGTTAIQLAKASGANVVTTAGSDRKCRFCLEIGADHAINYRETDWVAGVRDRTAGKGVDVVLDMVAGSYVQPNLDLLNRDGRYALIAFLDGAEATLNLSPVLRKRLTLSGSTLRPQTIEEKADIAFNLERQVLPWLADGTVRPIIYRCFALEDAAAAHTLMESSRHMGKIVLEVAELAVS